MASVSPGTEIQEKKKLLQSKRPLIIESVILKNIVNCHL